MSSEGAKMLINIIDWVQDPLNDEWNKLTPHQMYQKMSVKMLEGRNASFMSESPSVTRDISLKLANALLKRYGRFAVVLMAPRNGKINLMSFGEYITLCAHESEHPMHKRRRLLFEAMRQVGFKITSEMSDEDLIYEYRQYKEAVPRERILNLKNEKYPYKAMWLNRAPIKEELHMRFYHPSRVAKWLEDNPDKELEEYLV